MTRLLNDMDLADVETHFRPGAPRDLPKSAMRGVNEYPMSVRDRAAWWLHLADLRAAVLDRFPFSKLARARFLQANAEYVELIDTLPLFDPRFEQRFHLGTVRMVAAGRADAV